MRSERERRIRAEGEKREGKRSRSANSERWLGSGINEKIRYAEVGNLHGSRSCASSGALVHITLYKYPICFLARFSVHGDNNRGCRQTDIVLLTRPSFVVATATAVESGLENTWHTSMTGKFRNRFEIVEMDSGCGFMRVLRHRFELDHVANSAL